PARQPACRLTRQPPCAPSLTVGFLPIYRRRGRNPSVSQGAGSSGSLPVHPPLRSAFCRLIIAVMAETSVSEGASSSGSLPVHPYGRVSADISPSWRKPERQRGCRSSGCPPVHHPLRSGFCRSIPVLAATRATPRVPP